MTDTKRFLALSFQKGENPLFIWKEEETFNTNKECKDMSRLEKYEKNGSQI